MPHTKKTAILLILDGFGVREDTQDNAVLQAHTPNLDQYRKQFAYNTINASERMVGLPRGQFGNSEVGHLNIGAGRVVEQDITRIDIAIEEGKYAQNAVLQDTFNKAKSTKLHLLGLFSDGGVHSHVDHIFATIDAAIAAGVVQIVVHPFLDGRDTPPKSAEPFLQKLESYCNKYTSVQIGTVMGRFYAMDRDKRWERVSAAYQALVENTAPFHAQNALQALSMGYERDEMDEFIQPTIIGNGHPIEDGDVVLFLNFRADRARQLTIALTDASFNEFPHKKVKLAGFASMTSYGDQFVFPVLFVPHKIQNSFGEYISAQGLTQLRIAETEKYPHVTYFFSGGTETPFAGEERILVPSPKVKTYDLQPQMSAYEVTEHIVDVLNQHRFDVIICNFANGDMVGHSGHLDAAIKAVETLDKCVGKIVEAAQKNNAEVLITADHGNCEQMFDNKHHQIHTQHTLNPVPFIYIGRQATIKSGGALKDIAPSLLSILGLPKPPEMTGDSLIEFTA